MHCSRFSKWKIIYVGGKSVKLDSGFVLRKCITYAVRSPFANRAWLDCREKEDWFEFPSKYMEAIKCVKIAVKPGARRARSLQLATCNLELATCDSKDNAPKPYSHTVSHTWSRTRLCGGGRVCLYKLQHFIKCLVITPERTRVASTSNVITCLMKLKGFEGAKEH